MPVHLLGTLSNNSLLYHILSGRTNRSLNRIARRAISMAWYCSGSSNTELIENLYNAGLIKNERVKKAMLGVSSSLIPSSL